jgi:alkylation response protein AidB-like acyl-CoA dehydrogenase
MSDYTPPLPEIRFVLDEIAGLDEVAVLPGFEETTGTLADAVLGEAGRLARDMLAPLNHTGDREGARLENGIVYTPAGWTEAYSRFVDGGWMGLRFDADHGGQGLPRVVSTAVMELWHSANLAFTLCPMLTQGASELLAQHGSEAQKRTYLRPMVAGRWTGTMNLTEPQAGSDLGAISTRAVPEDGHYRITGQKIFITYGEHDLAENIIHMLLARTPGAPAGVRGISLFIVPKLLPREDGTPGKRNDLRAVSLEDKLGIHASPTCVMAFGDGGGAIGYLVGEENRGLEYMFTMMNDERLAVGLQGVGIAERAYQQALGFARQRVQGRADAGGPEKVAILGHPDVRRMLLSMKAQTEAMRALTYYTAAAMDRAHHDPDGEARAPQSALVEFLTPVVKAWPTDLACEIASMGIQVHGGMGFIEETGAAQHFRDARITPIYEGTNGIQARDLVGRKVLREGGQTARALIAVMREDAAALESAADADLGAIRARLERGIAAFEAATGWLLEAGASDPRLAAAAAAPYLRLVGTITGGWLLARGAARAKARLGDGADPFLAAKPVTARFYAENVMPHADALLAAITEGAGTVLVLADDQF